AGFTPYLIGIGGTQSLAHILNMTSTMDELEGKKVVFVLSPQWFTKTGVSQGDFTNNSDEPYIGKYCEFSNIFCCKNTLCN
ncbi:D-alanyl-lipoteichoic acid biosynthesis protein DltD, partial [Bacillus sp. D-CC]